MINERLEVLLSAMYLDSYDYIDTLNITGDCTVINQTDYDSDIRITEDLRVVKYICTKERGLSKSRNMAIKYSTNDICILCDNDIEYVEGYSNIIEKSFSDHPDADIICFHLNRRGQRKPLYRRCKKIGKRTIGKITSAQIAFRKKAIADIEFNELLGAGSKYSAGEESVFLANCCRKQKRIYYDPQLIANVREEESTWFKGFTDKYFRDKGACFYLTADNVLILAYIKCALFAIKVKIKHDHSIKCRQAYFNMISGIREYISDVKNG